MWEQWAREQGITKAPRDALARAVGTSGSNLSGLNKGRLLMTADMAQRIVKVTGRSVLDLGAPVTAAGPDDRGAVDRLLELEAEVDDLRATLLRGFAALKPLLPQSKQRALVVPPSPRQRAQNGSS